MTTARQQSTGMQRRDNRLAGYRNVVAIVTSLTCLQAAQTGLSMTVVLTLRANGAGSLTLGLISGAFAIGFLTGALVSPREIQRIGHIRAFTLFAAIGQVCALSYMLEPPVWVWAIIQGVLGICFAGLWAAGESWVADAAPADQRGAILGFYNVVAKCGAISGPFLIAHFGLALAFPAVAGLFALSIAPIAATSRSQPDVTSTTPFGPMQILKTAPAAAIAAFAAGFVNGSVAQLYPVFVGSLTAGGSQSAASLAAQFNGALLLGSVITVWPAGIASDHVDRRLVVAALAILAAAAAAVMALFGASLPQDVMLTTSCLYGAGALSFYAVAVAHAADRAGPNQTTSMMAGILVIWGVGSIVGPLAAGVSMTLPTGPAGLFLFAAGTYAVLALVMLQRTFVRSETPAPDKASYAPSQATSIAIASLDPRRDDDIVPASEADRPPPGVVD